MDEVSQSLAAFHALDTPMFNSGVAASSHPTTVSSTPVRHHPTSRPPDLRRLSLEASPLGREEVFFDSPLAVHEPIPFHEPLPSREEPDALADDSVA